MAHYSVWVEMVGGANRIALSEGTDAQAASDLVGALVAASQGVSFEIGVSITQDTATPPPGGTPTPGTPRQPARR